MTQLVNLAPAGETSFLFDIPPGEWNVDYVHIFPTYDPDQPQDGYVTVSHVSAGLEMPFVHKEPMSPAHAFSNAWPNIKVLEGEKIKFTVQWPTYANPCRFTVFLTKVN